MLAVLLLGIPLAVAGALLVRDSAIQEAQRRADSLARTVERRLVAGQEIDDELLESGVGREGEFPAQVIVLTPEAALGAGDAVDGPAYRAETSTPSGASVQVLVPRSAVTAGAVRAVGLVVGVAVIAVAAGVALALVQARRLAAPLDELARGAQRLGSGDTRFRPLRTGVEEVDLVASELSRSADRMAARLAAEREFAADVSHQLRTPLTALSMRLEEIEASSDSADVQQEARIALEQIERLVAVVDELLVRTRRNHNGDSSGARTVSLDEVLTQQSEEWLPSFTAAGRVLDVQAPPGLRLRASPGGLGQVLATLLENSLVHGAGTTSVRARRSATSLVIEVSDEGPGVPDELGSRVFERNVSGVSGTGLGLAVARDLVSADGGRLELLSHRPPLFAVFLSTGSAQLGEDQPAVRPEPEHRPEHEPYDVR